MALLRQQVRVQYNNIDDINHEIDRIKSQYPNAIVKPSLKPVQLLDEITTDSLMWVDIIY